MSYPALTAFFCSSILDFCTFDRVDLSSLIASSGSRVFIWIEMEILLSISSNFLSSSSLILGAIISRYFVHPNICPALNLPG